jgi:thiol-disulfide isomerase/thioredoxin/polyisoprenoid-binding protein YceI
MRTLPMTLTLACAAAMAMWAPVQRAAADPAGDQLREQVAKAYQTTQTYRSDVLFKFEQVNGRWTNTQSTDFKVAIDRVSNKVLIDKPEFIIVADGKKLKVVVREVPGSHVEKDAPAQITYEVLTTLVTMPGMSWLTQPMVIPDVALLTGKDPITALASQEVTQIEALPPDPTDKANRPGLKFVNFQGTWTLRVDPASHLVTAATVEMTGSDPRGNFARMTYQINIEKHDEPLGPDAFALDTTNSKPTDSLDALAKAQAQAAQAAAGQGAGGQGGVHPLEGQKAPPVVLKTLDGKAFDLATVKADVIVFDFWATWCPPCRRGLPELQKVHEWAVKNKKSVAIYTINLQEPADQVGQFWTAGKFTMPVLMDSNGAVAQAYHVEGIPQTVIISAGKVERVHEGLIPDLAKSLQTDIDALLEKAKTAGKSKN